MWPASGLAATNDVLPADPSKNSVKENSSSPSTVPIHARDLKWPDSFSETHGDGSNQPRQRRARTLAIIRLVLAHNTPPVTITVASLLTSCDFFGRTGASECPTRGCAWTLGRKPRLRGRRAVVPEWRARINTCVAASKAMGMYGAGGGSGGSLY